MCYNSVAPLWQIYTSLCTLNNSISGLVSPPQLSVSLWNRAKCHQDESISLLVEQHTHTHSAVLCSAAPLSLELPQASRIYPFANVANRLLHLFSREPFFFILGFLTIFEALNCDERRNESFPFFSLAFYGLSVSVLTPLTRLPALLSHVLDIRVSSCVTPPSFFNLPHRSSPPSVAMCFNLVLTHPPLPHSPVE